MQDDPGIPREPRQRWRLVLARATTAPAQTQRELSDTWEAAILGAGLPLAFSEGATPRPRISFGAPLPVGMAADGELIDIVLTERLPVFRVRESLSTVLPDGWRLVDVQDVWLAGPALAGRVAAADHRITLVDGDPAGLAGACAALLAAGAVTRERAKGGGTVTYDLRPLVIDVTIADAGPPPVVAARTRFHPELGTGRPEEVVGALADLVGAPLAIESIVRERLILAEDLDPPHD